MFENKSCNTQSAMILFKPLHSNFNAKDRTKIIFKYKKNMSLEAGSNSFKIGVLGIKKNVKFDLNSITDIFHVAAPKHSTKNMYNYHRSISIPLTFSGSKIFNAHGLKFGEDVKCFYLFHYSILGKKYLEGDYNLGTGFKIAPLKNNDNFFYQPHECTTNYREIYDRFGCSCDDSCRISWSNIACEIDFIMTLDNNKHQLSFFCNNFETPVTLNKEFCTYLKQWYNIVVSKSGDAITLQREYYYLPFFETQGCPWMFNIEIL